MVEAHAWTSVAGGRNGDEVWVKLVVDTESVSSES